MSKSRKKTRRFLRRMAERKGMEYRDAISFFYRKGISKIDKKILIELNPDSRCDRIL